MGNETTAASDDPSQSSQFPAIFEQAFRSAPFGIHLTDGDGHFLQVNPALCRTLGYDEPELLGMRWQDITHPDDLAETTERREEIFEGQAGVQFSKRYLHNSGRVIWCRVNLSLLRDAEDRPRYAIAQLEDISRQRELEQQLIQAQKMEAVGRLAGGVAHDFNNLLLVINNYAQMLRDDMTQGDPRREDLDEIVTAGGKAARLVQQLLAFSRRDVAQAQVVSLNQVIDGLLGLLPRTLGADIELKATLDPELWNTLIDVSQLEQIIVNLAVNAREAMPDGATSSWQRRTSSSMRRRSRPRLARVDTFSSPSPTTPRYQAGCPCKNVRALLHHQTARGGQRTRAGERLRDRGASGRDGRRDQ